MYIFYKRMSRRYISCNRQAIFILFATVLIFVYCLYFIWNFRHDHLNTTISPTLDSFPMKIELTLRPLLLGNFSLLSDPTFLISPILHQIFIPPAERHTTNLRERWLPGVYSPTIRSLLQKHRSYRYWVWFTHTANLFTRRIYSEYSLIQQQYFRFDHIRQSDAIRYLLLFHFGGVYVDMDYLAHRSLDDLLRRYECILVREPEPSALFRWDRDFLLSNGFMAARPAHPLFAHLVGALGDRRPSPEPARETGPLFLTDKFLEFATRSNCSHELQPLLNVSHPTSDLGAVEACGCAILPWHLFTPRMDEQFVNTKLFQHRCEDAFAARHTRGMRACAFWARRLYADSLFDANTFLEHRWFHLIFDRARLLERDRNDMYVEDVVAAAGLASQLDLRPENRLP